MLHRMKSEGTGKTYARRKVLALAAMAVAATAIRAVVVQADTTATWTGANSASNSYWNNTANWSPATVPNNNLPTTGTIYDVTINTSGGSINHADLSGFSPTIAYLDIAAGDSIYNSGGTTETLTIDPSTMGTATGSVIDGNIGSTGSQIVLNFGNGNSSAVTSTVSGTLTGNVGLVIDQPAGTVVLSNTGNTYTGGTKLDGGTLSISSGSNLGSGAVTFDGGTLQTAASLVTVGNNIVLNGTGTIDVDGHGSLFEGTISGAGGLTIADSSSTGGSIALTAAETYTGATVVDPSNVLALENSGSISDSSGVTVNGTSLAPGELDISNITATGTSIKSLSGNAYGLVYLGNKTLTLTNASGTFAGNIFDNNNGGSVALDSGTEVLSGNNTYSGGTAINGGTLSISSAANLGTGGVSFNGGTLQTTAGVNLGNSINVNSGGGTIDGGSQNVTLNGTITNTSGTLTLQDGVIALGSTSNATDFTGGTLQVGNGSGTSVAQFTAAGNLPAAGVGITLNQGTLDYTGTGLLNLANAITVSGSGTTGVLENSSSGMETLTGSISNATAGNILAFSGGTFNLNEAGSGSGTFEIGDAPSTVIVSNPNAFGSGAIIVNTGSTLETSDAVLGAGPVMTVTAGSFTENSGGTLKLLATGNGVNDSIALGGGAASLNGELNLIFSGFTPASGQHYTVVSTTGTVSGNFSSIVLTGAPSLMIGTGSAVAGTGEEITLSYSAFFTGLSGLTPNQASIAAYLNDNAVLPGVPSVIVNALGTISALPQNLQAQYLDELTPQAYSQLPQQSIQNNTFMAQQLFSQVQNAFDGGGFNTSGLMMLKTNDQDPFAVSMDSALASAQQQAKNSVAYMDNSPQLVGMPGVGPILPAQESALGNLSGFVLGTITVDQLQQNNTPTQNFTTGSVMAGLDYRLNRNLVVGGLFNWAYTGGTLDNVGSRQRSSSYTPGVFVGYKQGGFYADALMAYTYNSYQINRTVNMPGSSSIATGEPDSNEYDANALVGYYLPLARGFRAGPAAGVGFTQINMSGYSETGSPFDLTVAKQHADSLRSLLGMQAQYSFAPENNPLPISINFNAFWQHEFLDSARNINASFTQLGGGSFIFTTAGPSRDSALLGLGASGYIGKQVSLFVNYETQVGDHRQFAQSVMAGVAVSF